MDEATIDSTTTPSATGLPGNQHSPRQEQQDRDDTKRQHEKVYLIQLPGNSTSLSKELCPPPGTPKRLGS